RSSGLERVIDLAATGAAFRPNLLWRADDEAARHDVGAGGPAEAGPVAANRRIRTHGRDPLVHARRSNVGRCVGDVTDGDHTAVSASSQIFLRQRLLAANAARQNYSQGGKQ